MSLCSWNDSHGTTCRWPGPFSADTHGGGRYYCVWHWRAFGLDRLDMKTEGDRVVRESLEWDGSPESYFALRLSPETNAGSRKPVAHDHPSPEPAIARNDAQRVEGLSRLPKKISELVPQMEPGTADW